VMIVTVIPKRKQLHSEITFSGDAVPHDYAAKDFHLDITAINCEKPKCKPRPHCQSILSNSCKCGDGHIQETKEAESWILRYEATERTGCTLRFDWCDLLWGLPPMLYDAVLYRCGEPCGRFRIQLRSGTVYGADVTEIAGC